MLGQVLSSYGFWFTAAITLIGGIVGIAGTVTNKDQQPATRTLLTIAIAFATLLGVVSEGRNLLDSLAENDKLQQHIDRLGSPIVNTEVTYEVSIPLSDRRLEALKTGLMRSARQMEFRYNHLSPPEWVSPRMPLTDILRELPPWPTPYFFDASFTFLRSMDVEVDFFRPPADGAQTSNADYPDLQLSTEYLSPLPLTVAKSVQLPHPLGRIAPIESSPYDIVLCECKQSEVFTNPAPFVSAYDVPIKRSLRSGKLDSLLELAGSTMEIHLRPDYETLAAQPDILKGARLKLFTLTVDGINYHTDLTKAVVVPTPLFNIYAIRIPKNWDPVSRAFP
jgi:hypothetical protein